MRVCARLGYRARTRRHLVDIVVVLDAYADGSAELATHAGSTTVLVTRSSARSAWSTGVRTRRERVPATGGATGSAVATCTCTAPTSCRCTVCRCTVSEITRLGA